MTPDEHEWIGLLADQCENLVAAMNLKLPPELHLECLREALTEVQARLRGKYIELTGEDPWT